MGFYDDASLILLAGAEAGKDGKAYSIKPVPEYGSELVTNGDFASGSNGWSVSNGSVTDKYNASMSAYQSGIKITPFVQNGTFKVVFDLVVSSGSCKFDAGGSNNEIITTSGTKEIIITNPTKFEFNAFNTGWSGTLDNVSVKEVIVDGDFTFSRGSNLSATRVGADGLIEKGRENLLLQSNAFSTSPWLQTDATATIGQSGYDGTNNAWLIDKSGANGRIRQLVSSTGVLTTSVYAKAGTNDWLRISFAKFAYFDLANGVIGNTNALDTTITSVGNGWYRCTMTANSTSTQYANYYPAEDDNVISGTSGNIIMQSIQIEQGLAATDYIESGATTGKAGLLEDEPRFDYSGGATCPSLLLEPSRTQLIGQSEYFGGWQIFGSGSVTLTANQIVSPEGVQNAYLLETTSDNKGIYISCGSLSSGNVVTISVYLKQKVGGSSIVRFGTSGASFGGDKASRFDLSDGTIEYENPANDSVSIESVGDGWYRCVITDTATANGTLAVILYSYLDGNASCDFYAYGAQAEAGSYPTSYIPNHSGGTITRGADEATDAGDASTFNSTEGVLYAEIAALADDGTTRRISIIGTSANDRINISFSTGSNRLQCFAFVGGALQFNFTPTLSNIKQFNKIAVKYKENDFALWVNGVEVATDTSGISWPANTLNNLLFANSEAYTEPFYGKAKQILYFPTALSDADLTTLTTL